MENEGVNKSYATITAGEHTFELAEPTFDVTARAIQKLIGQGSGETDMVGAGSVIFDACYKANELPLADVKSNTKLYISVCLQCASLLEIEEAEIKKN